MLNPIGDHVLVMPISEREVTKSGIVLPETAKEKPQQGKVVAVGQGKYVNGTLVSFKELGVEVGQTIMFSKYGPTEIKLNDEDFYILESGDILGVLKK